MIFLTIDYRDEDDTWSEQTITRKFSDDVSDETLKEAVVDLKNKVTE